VEACLAPTCVQKRGPGATRNVAPHAQAPTRRPPRANPIGASTRSENLSRERSATGPRKPAAPTQKRPAATPVQQEHPRTNVGPTQAQPRSIAGATQVHRRCNPGPTQAQPRPNPGPPRRPTQAHPGPPRRRTLVQPGPTQPGQGPWGRRANAFVPLCRGDRRPRVGYCRCANDGHAQDQLPKKGANNAQVWGRTPRDGAGLQRHNSSR
jgi:hypothetical protein